MRISMRTKDCIGTWWYCATIIDDTHNLRLVLNIVVWKSILWVSLSTNAMGMFSPIHLFPLITYTLLQWHWSILLVLEATCHWQIHPTAIAMSDRVAQGTAEMTSTHSEAIVGGVRSKESPILMRTRPRTQFPYRFISRQGRAPERCRQKSLPHHTLFGLVGTSSITRFESELPWAPNLMLNLKCYEKLSGSTFWIS